MQKQNLTRASSELFRRPADERFESLAALREHCRGRKQQSFDHWCPPDELKPYAVDADPDCLEYLHRCMVEITRSGRSETYLKIFHLMVHCGEPSDDEGALNEAMHRQFSVEEFGTVLESIAMSLVPKDAMPNAAAAFEFLGFIGDLLNQYTEHLGAEGRLNNILTKINGLALLASVLRSIPNLAFATISESKSGPITKPPKNRQAALEGNLALCVASPIGIGWRSSHRPGDYAQRMSTEQMGIRLACLDLPCSMPISWCCDPHSRWRVSSEVCVTTKIGV